MLQRLFRGQSEQADAIATASDTLDAAIEDAQTQRDALQEQYDALQQQISELWTQADAICSQMYELDKAIGDAAGEIGGTGVTVQVYSRGSSGRRAELSGDAEAAYIEVSNQHTKLLDEINRYTRQMDTHGSSDLQVAVDHLGEFVPQLEDLEQQMSDIENSAERYGVFGSSRASPGRRAAGDDGIRRQLEALNQEKGVVINEIDAIEKKYNLPGRDDDADELRTAADRLDELGARNDELSSEMDDLFEQDEEIDPNDFENY